MQNHNSELAIKETLSLQGVDSPETLDTLKSTINIKLKQISPRVDNRGMIFVEDNTLSVSTTMPKPIEKALSLLNITHDAAAAVISTSSILKASRQAEDGNINPERLAISETADVKNKPIAQTHVELFSDNKELVYSQIQIAALIAADAHNAFRNRSNDIDQETDPAAFSVSRTKVGVVDINIDSSPHTAANVALLFSILGNEKNCKNTLDILSVLPENTNKVAALFNANKVQVADLVGQENTEALGKVITQKPAAPVLALAA